jgi:hypothetical protein
MSDELIQVMGGRDGKYTEFKSLCSIFDKPLMQSTLGDLVEALKTLK